MAAGFVPITALLPLLIRMHPIIRCDLRVAVCLIIAPAAVMPASAIPRLSEKCSKKTGGYTREEGMSRFAVGLLVVACLMLTAYFGAAAWRASDDNQMDITGRIGPAAK